MTNLRGAGRQEPAMLVALGQMDADALARLLTLRPDLADPAPRNLVALAARAGDPASVELCRLGLDLGAQQVLEALCLLPAPTTVGELAGVLGVSSGDRDLSAVLGRLCDRALVGRDAEGGGDGVRLLAKVAVRHPAGLGPSVAAALGAQPASSLGSIAMRIGAEPGRTKSDMLEEIAAVLSSPRTLARLLASAPAGAADVAKRLAFEGPEGYAPGATYAAVRSEQTAVGWMVSRGILAPIGWDTVVLVGEAGLALRGGTLFPELAFTRPELDLHPVDAASVDRSSSERALRLVGDIVSILDVWAADGPRPLKAGGIGIQVIRKAAKAVDRSEVETARVIELAALAGLVAVDAGTGLALPLPAYDEWCALEAPGRWARLVGAWMASNLHLSVAGAEDDKGKPIGPLLPRVPEPRAIARRQRLLAALAEAPVGMGVTSESVFARAGWDSPGLWTGGPAVRPLLGLWILLECQLLGVSALGSLSTWGRLVASGDVDGAEAALAGVVPAATSEFIVQADLTALAPAELVKPVHAELESIADLESRGGAALYRFTEASVRRGFEAGRSASDILAFLEAHAAKGVPQALTYLVNDVERRFGRLRVVAVASCLRCDDPALLAEVVASRPAKKLGLRLVAPTVAVATADAATMLDTLRDAGFLPAAEGADGVVVVSRPPRRRAVVNPRLAAVTRGLLSPAAAVSAASPAAPVEEVAARLVQAGVEEAAAAARSPAPAPGASPFELPSAVSRPDRIVRSPSAVADLLADAMDEGWPVRLAYTNAKGRTAQLNVAVLDVSTREAVVELLIGWDSRVLTLSRIDWARVLTEAEEEAL